MKSLLKEYVAVEDYMSADGTTVLVPKGTKIRQMSEGDQRFQSVINSSVALYESAITGSDAFRPVQLLLD